MQNSLVATKTTAIMSKKKKNVKKKAPIQSDPKILKQKKQIRTISVIFFIIALIIIPNLYFEQIMDPTLIPRFTALAILLLFALLFLTLKKQTKKDFSNVLKQPIVLLYFAFFALSAISLFNAHLPSEGIYDVLKSFLMFMLLVITATFLINENNKNLLDSVIKVVAINSLIIVSITLYDLIYSLSKIEKWWSFAAEVKGFMANKNQLSIALFLLLPFNIYALLKHKTFWKVLAAINLLLIFGEIVVLRTRSVWIAVSISTFIFVAIYLFFGKAFTEKINKKIRFLTIILIFVFLGSTVLFISLSDSKIATYVKTSASSLDKMNEDFSRYKVWNGTLEMTKDNPVIGVGAGNWKIHMSDYYDLGDEEDFQNWRRPHNDFLWNASEKGIIGGILFFLISIFPFVLAYRTFRANNISKNKKLLVLVLISFFIGYLICSMLTFPYERMNHQIYITTIVSIILGIYISHSAIKERKNKPILKLSLIFAGLSILVFSIYYGSIAFNMEKNLKKCIGFKNAQKWNYVIHFANKGYNPLTKLAPSSAPIHWYRGLGHYMTKNYKQALSDFKYSYELQPNHPYVITYYASLEGYFGNNRLAIDLLKHTLQNYPKYEDALVNTFAAYYKIKQFDSANYYLKQCDPKSKNKYVIEYRKAIEQTFVNLSAKYYNNEQYDSAFYYINKCDIHSNNKDVKKYKDLIEEKLNEL